MTQKLRKKLSGNDFRNNFVSEGISKPVVWGTRGLHTGFRWCFREVLHGVGADGVGVKFPIFAVNGCCLPLSFRRRREKRRKGEKCIKKGKNAQKTGKNA